MADPRYTQSYAVPQYPGPMAQRQWQPMRMPATPLPGYPRQPYATQGRPGMPNPAAKSLMTPGASLPSVTPEQLQLLQQGKLSPEMMQVASQWMQDPKVRAQLAQMQGLVQQGKLTPDMITQMMGPNMPKLPPGMENFTPDNILKALALSFGLGIPLTMGVNRFVYGNGKQANSPMIDMLRSFEKFSRVQILNKSIQQRIDSVKALPVPEDSFWVNFFDAYKPQQFEKNYISAYLGHKGEFTQELRPLLKQFPQVLEHLEHATSKAEILQVLEPTLSNFFPDSVRELVSQETKVGFLQNLFNAGASQSSSSVTLGELEWLHDKHQLLKFLGGNTGPGKRITPDILRSIHEVLEKRAPQHIKTPSERFVYNLKQLLTNSQNRSLATPLKATLGLGNDTSYSAIRNALQTQTGGYTSITRMLQEASKDVVGTMNLEDKTTLGTLNRHFLRRHIMNRLNNTHIVMGNNSQAQGIQRLFNNLFRSPRQVKVGERLTSMLHGFIKRVKYLENNYIPIAEEKLAFSQRLTHRGVGPIGRALGKMGFYLGRIMDGARMTRLTTNGRISSPLMGRIFFTTLTFGIAAFTALKEPHESRVSRFADTMATSVGGFFGYELGRNLVHETGLLTRVPALRWLSTKKFLGFCPWSWGGFLTEVVIPATVGAAVSYGLQGLTNLAFGNPDQIAKQKQFAEDQKRQLTTPNGLLQRVSTGDIKIPGIVKGVDAFTSREANPASPVLTPQSVGLTPEQIAVSEAANADNAVMQRFQLQNQNGVHLPEF